MSDRHHVELRCPTGNPAETTVFVDGEHVTWAQRIELILDAQTGEATVKVTVPARVLDIDVDAAAFVTAHVEASPLPPGRYTPGQVAEHHKQH